MTTKVNYSVKLRGEGGGYLGNYITTLQRDFFIVYSLYSKAQKPYILEGMIDQC